MLQSNASYLRKYLSLTGSWLKSARLLSEEAIKVGGRKITCFVIEYSSDDARTPDPPGTPKQQRCGIDKAHKTIVKSVATADREQIWTPGLQRQSLYKIATHSESMTTYPVVILNAPIPAHRLYPLCRQPKPNSLKPSTIRTPQIQPMQLYRKAAGCHWKVRSQAHLPLD